MLKQKVVKVVTPNDNTDGMPNIKSEMIRSNEKRQGEILVENIADELSLAVEDTDRMKLMIKFDSKPLLPEISPVKSIQSPKGEVQLATIAEKSNFRFPIFRIILSSNILYLQL